MAKFCPECGKPTVKMLIDHRKRDACTEGHFIQFAQTRIGVGALIIHDDKVLLVERGIPPVGLWTLVSGYIEQDETIDQAIKREAMEEVGLNIAPQGLIYVRNQQKPLFNDIYLVFLCHVLDDPTPKPDGTETTDAKYFPFDKINTVDASPYAIWFIEMYLAQGIQPWHWQPTSFDLPTTRIYTQAPSS